MSEQLNHTKNSEVVYIDFSKSSMSVSQTMVRLRNTNNTVWINAWIEEISILGLGHFDFVVCTGVLHHLKNPQRALRVIRKSQTKSGGAALMVYGKHGRISTYQIQHLMRFINEKEMNLNREISNAKHIINVVPRNHWFPHGEISDHQTMGNVGIYDLLLHKRDIPFSIPELHIWTESSGYNIIDFSFPLYSSLISPKLNILENFLYQNIIRQSIQRQHWVGEVMSGYVFQHNVFVSTNVNSEASMGDINNELIAYGSPVGFQRILSSQYGKVVIRNETFISARIGNSFIDEGTGFTDASDWNMGGISTELVFPLSDLSKYVITKLTKKPIRPYSLEELLKSFKENMNSQHSINFLHKKLKELITYLKFTGVFFLKHKSVGLYPKTCCHNRFRVLGNQKELLQN